MTTPPDKLFRQGLENYQKPAPGSAWERIESGLDRKRNRTSWMKIAAGLLIVIVTSVMILQNHQTESAIATAFKKSAPVTLETDSTVDVATVMQETVDSSQLAVGSPQLNSIVERSRNNQLDVVKKNLPVVERSRIKPSRNSLQSAVPSPQSAVSSQQSAVSTQKTVSPDESHMAATTEQVEINIDPTSVTQVEITNEISAPNVASNSKRTNITYTAKEVNAKYLKKELTPEATPEKKNTSGLQKVIDLALDFKNEGSVLGDIREKKNEWLSFTGPSNKRETNK